MTQLLPITSITISPDRQRQEFNPDALTELGNSIQALGLMHPIVVRNTPTGPVLVAGERRLRAITDLHALGVTARFHGAPIAPDTVPTTTLGELSPMEAEEAELDENLKRQNLTWQEEASAIARLHSLRTGQALSRGETHTISKTIDEITPIEGTRPSYTDVREKIIVANYLSNPEVAKAKTPKDAVKIIRRQEETKRNEELAERVGATYSAETHNLINANCLDWMYQHLELESSIRYDLVLTDPPYGMGADTFGDGGGKQSNSEHHYADSYQEWQNLIRPFVKAIYAITKPQAHAYIFCDIDRFHELKQYMEEAGWYVFRTPLTVYKLGSGRVPLPENGPRRQSEWCLYAIKGWKPVTAIYPDVIPCKLEENIGHGANKPVELYTDLLRRSCRPGDSVLDCFAGTGTIFPAAQQLKVRATGIELSPEYYAIAWKRLESLEAPEQPIDTA